MKFRWVRNRERASGDKITRWGHPDYRNKERNRRIFSKMYEVSGISYEDIGLLIGVSKQMVNLVLRPISDDDGAFIRTDNLVGALEAVANSLEDRARKIRALRRSVR